MYTEMSRAEANDWVDLLDAFPVDEDQPEAWRDEAVCASVDADLFFPEKSSGTNSFATPKRVCRRCPVRIDCLRTAVVGGDAYGIWGGLAAKDVAAVRVAWRARRAGEATADVAAEVAA